MGFYGSLGLCQVLSSCLRPSRTIIFPSKCITLNSSVQVQLLAWGTIGKVCFFLQVDKETSIYLSSPTFHSPVTSHEFIRQLDCRKRRLIKFTAIRSFRGLYQVF